MRMREHKYWERFAKYASDACRPPRNVLAGATAAVIERLEARINFGYVSADPSDEGPPPIEPCGCDGDCPDPNTGSAPAASSERPVRYFDGHPIANATDLKSDGFGESWGHTRSWTGLNNNSHNGNGWSVTELPFLYVGGGRNGNVVGSYSYVHPDRVSVVSGNGASATFSIDSTGLTYTSWDANPNTLQCVTGTPNVMRLTDAQGNVTEFYDVRRDANGRPVTGSLANDLAQKYGKFKSWTAANGSTTVQATYDVDGYLASVTRSDAGVNDVERYLYAYATITNDLVTAAGKPSAKLVSHVTLERSANGGSTFAPVRRAAYTYYTGRVSNGSGGWNNDPHGRLGDLKLVTIQAPVDPLATPVVWQDVDTTYYRYYKFLGESFNNYDSSVFGSRPSSASQGPTNDVDTTGGPAAWDTNQFNLNSPPTGPTAGLRFVTSGLKSVVSGASFSRLTAAHADYQDATDAQVKTYADHTFRYERWGDHTNYFADPETSSNSTPPSSYTYNSPFVVDYGLGTRYRVTEETAQGAGCSTCSGGQGTYKFEYAISSHGGFGYTSREYNTWRMKTTEYLPDTTNLDADADGLIDAGEWADNDQKIVYTNEFGQAMLEVIVDRNGTSSTSDDKVYTTYFRYNEAGRLILKADPSAVTPYDPVTHASLDGYLAIFEAHPDMAGWNGTDYNNLRDGEGLIEERQYGSTLTAGSSTAGDVEGYLKSVWLRRGDQTSAILQLYQQYYEHTYNGSKAYPVALTRTYANETSNVNDASKRETTYTYTRWKDGSNVDTNQIRSVETTLPAVTAAHNGPNTADVTLVVFDRHGRAVWTKDAEGYLTYTGYDVGTGAVKERIEDANPSLISSPPVASPGRGSGLPAALHLVTSTESDGLGRTTKVTDPEGNITYAVYNDAAHEVRVYRGWHLLSDNGTPANPDDDTWATTGPVEVTREYRNGTPDGGVGRVYFETLTMDVFSFGTSTPTGFEIPNSGNIKSLSRSLTNNAGQVVETNEYFAIPSGYSQQDIRPGDPSNNSGDSNVHYHSTEFQYDGRGRVKRVKTPSGTITRTVYDGRGNPMSVWIGTDDIGWTPDAPGSNMKEVTKYEYDNGTIGDGNLTKVTAKPGGTAADRVTQMFYDWRKRLVAKKEGVQASESDTSVQRQITYLTYDNLNRVRFEQRFDGDGVTITTTDGVPVEPSALRTAKTETEYDARGRVFASRAYSVNGSGTVGNSLNTNYWYDRRGNLIKTSEPGGIVKKSAYDGAGRVTKSYVTDGGASTASPDSSWSDATNVTGDIVLTQTENQYDGNGNVILTTTRQRFHNTVGTGELGTPLSTGATAKARVSYSGFHYDDANRMIHAIDVGTNFSSGTDFTLHDNLTTSVPPRSDTALVTSYVYDSAGRLWKATDPRGIDTQTFYDALGRTTATIEGYADGAPSAADDRTTQYTYDGSDHVLTMKAVLPDGPDANADPDIQETRYVYGVTAGAGGSNINSNEILGATQYPDKSTGAASASEQETCKVNALGEKIKCADRNGTVHEYTYDVLGRLTKDAVTTAVAVDDRVLRLEFSFDSAGRPYEFTSYNAASGGSVVNQVRRAYNGFGQLVTEHQAVSGPVGGGTPYVEYAYSQTEGGTVNHSRLKSIKYPNGRLLRYEYGSGVDERISRLAFLADGTSTTIGTHLEEYSYLGLDTVVRRVRPQPDVALTYDSTDVALATGDAGDKYTGLDRFGRVVDQAWYDFGTDDFTDRFQYGYDRNSNRLYQDNLLNDDFDEVYSYDDLDRLTNMERGEFASGSIASPLLERGWSLDALGNWSSVTTDADGSGSGTPTTDNRTHNSQNQLTEAGGTSLAFNANGNTTAYPWPDDPSVTGEIWYDPWNRIVAVFAPQEESFAPPDADAVVSYTYDALGRRVTAGKWLEWSREFYYSAQWQVLEERDPALGDTATDHQYVWSPVYVDALVLRDRDAGALGGSLTERLYVQQDANFNVTALTDTASGALHERYAYDAYGAVTVLNAGWSPQDAGTYAMAYLHQGGRYETRTGLYHFRHRDYSPILGRWMQQDPAGYVDGMSLYEYVRSDPVSKNDPEGLSVLPEKPPTLPKKPIKECRVGVGMGFPLPHATIFVQTEQGTFGIDGQGPWTFGININTKRPRRVEFEPVAPAVCECLLDLDNRNSFNNLANKPRYSLFGSNSNRALGCYAKDCGVTVTWGIAPPGWPGKKTCCPG